MIKANTGAYLSFIVSLRLTSLSPSGLVSPYPCRFFASFRGGLALVSLFHDTHQRELVRYPVS